MRLVSSILETHKTYINKSNPLLKEKVNFLKNRRIKDNFRRLLGVDFIRASNTDPILLRLQHLVFELP